MNTKYPRNTTATPSLSPQNVHLLKPGIASVRPPPVPPEQQREVCVRFPRILSLENTLVRICCSSGLGAGVLMTFAPPWTRIKRRFTVSLEADTPDISLLNPVSTAPCSSTKLDLGSGSRREVILVTGGAGFLGQHVIRLLQERASNVDEIRVFDTRPYRNKLGKCDPFFGPIHCVIFSNR